MVKIFLQIITSNFLPLTKGPKPDFLAEPPFFTVTSPSSLKRKRNLTEPNFGESFPTRWAPNPLKRRGWSNSTLFSGRNEPHNQNISFMFDEIRGVVITPILNNDAKGAHRAHFFPKIFGLFLDRPRSRAWKIAKKVLAKHATIPSLDLPRWRLGAVVFFT